ncbi:Hsp70 family protein [Nocardia blacklockiae]|uniref:Hsp70 family protein n=1 Tax=Nocardia blacklockiae TaxID=480036 RepID=UPI0018932C2B|nr:Hsp70 family protein [Nocardia blacklockiae]MBF6175499.1 Hsp70 family protein [Nocardia blacklockiae]
MTQGLALGITVGSSHTVAVTTSCEYGSTDDVTVRTRPSAPPGVSDGFLARVGDPVDMLTADGSSVAAADLVAGVIGAVIDDHAPAHTVLGHPTWWQPHVVAAQRAALDAAGRHAVTLVPEAVAAVRRLAEEHRASEHDAVLVYDLGSTGLTVSVVGPAGLLAESVRADEVAGSEFDLLVLRYVLANALGDYDLDPFDPVVESELSALRQRCRKAKEDLSGITATVVEVRFPGLPGRDIRLVRDDIEELLREPLLDSMRSVREALTRAGVAVGAILPTGGGSAIPLLTELLSTEFGVPVIATAAPAHTGAHGAALLAADLLAESTETIAAPAVPTAPTDSLPAQRHHASSAQHAPPAPRAATRRDHTEQGKQHDRTPPTAQDHEPPAVSPLPALPEDADSRSRAGTWRRMALIGGAAAAVAALATGTLALGTAIDSPSSSTTSTTGSASSGGLQSAAQGSGATSGAAVGAAASGVPGSGSGTGAAVPVAATSAAGSPGQPGNPGQPGSPAQAGAPAPATGDPAAPGNPSAPAAPNSPAPQPPPVQAQPPNVPTAPSAPTLPAQPGGTLGDVIDHTGDTLGTVLDAPGQILGHTGG